uniref:Uncharacterized protein n=1 Tax=Arundo donax TaxID=35708 RepID=A0A0A9CEL2_ARUDO
MGKIEKKIGG